MKGKNLRVPNTKENRERLADEMADCMSLEDLIDCFKEQVIEKFAESDESFSEAWGCYIGNENEG
jgi:hypothetical protein